jgi:DNA-binding transcriptional ArsR family regulator
MSMHEQYSRREMFEQNPDLLRELEQAFSIPADPGFDSGAATDSGRTEDADDTANAGESSRSNWPDPLTDEAYQGLAGETVRMIEPHSEADSAALLVQFLVGFGNLIGRQPYFVTEADRQRCNLYSVIVGQTAKGRKGTSLGQIQRILATIDADWNHNRVMGGLASGEGLIWAVRDPIQERQPIREKGRITGYEDVESDSGVTDKRLLVVEPELARVLQVAERETNTLSPIIRQAWDTGTLRILTKKQQAQATDSHISIIAHITKDELRRLLTDTAAGNGFANRFLWVCSRRSKLLPEGGALDTVDFAPILECLKAAVTFARNAHQMQRDEQARAIWREVYGELSEGKPGLLGAVTSRAEAQTVRLACIYALLDSCDTVKADHLMAALAVWQYCEDSARFIFGDALGDATADEILRELRSHPEGMTRTDIREHFKRNKTSAEISRALGILQEYGLARFEREQGEQGRPSERWYALTAVRGKRA